MENLYIAVYWADDGQSTSLCQSECDDIRLNELKLEDSEDFISLVGWVPKYLHKGGDIDESDENFINFN